MIRKLPFLLLLVLSLNSESSYSHPWGGLVIDNLGNIYFSYICPLIDNGHFACVLKLDSNNEITEILKSDRSPSDIILSRNPARIVYAAERSGRSPNYRNFLWKIDPNGNEMIIQSFDRDNEFTIQSYAVDFDEIIYYSRLGQVFSSYSNSEIIFEFDVDRIQLMSLSPKGVLHIIADDNLYKLIDSELQLIATNLRVENPDNIPFQGANILFDMSIDEQSNVYLAYYGDRKILKVTNTGEISTVYESEAPFSPHGVDLFDGEIFILESTLGNGKSWKFLDRKDDKIIPRIIKIDTNGSVSEIYSYKLD
ncbi:MAG: hypothetical protein ACPGGA_02120 [Balneolaceae bacterium]